MNNKTNYSNISNIDSDGFYYYNLHNNFFVAAGSLCLFSFDIIPFILSK
jgi:hypothetical protein